MHIRSLQKVFDSIYLKKITPYLDIFKDTEGILRCRGRLNN